MKFPRAYPIFAKNSPPELTISDTPGILLRPPRIANVAANIPMNAANPAAPVIAALTGTLLTKNITPAITAINIANSAVATIVFSTGKHDIAMSNPPRSPKTTAIAIKDPIAPSTFEAQNSTNANNLTSTLIHAVATIIFSGLSIDNIATAAAITPIAIAALIKVLDAFSSTLPAIAATAINPSINIVNAATAANP